MREYKVKAHTEHWNDFFLVWFFTTKKEARELADKLIECKDYWDIEIEEMR